MSEEHSRDWLDGFKAAVLKGEEIDREVDNQCFSEKLLEMLWAELERLERQYEERRSH